MVSTVAKQPEAPALPMQCYGTYGFDDVMQKQWEEAEYPAILRDQAKGDALEYWISIQRWKRLLELADSYLAPNNWAIQGEPLCSGARVPRLV